MLLASYFALRMATECGRDYYPVFSEGVKKKLMAYRWPGNIRELKNTIERAVYSTEDKVITSVVFNPFENPYEDRNDDETEDIFSSYVLSDLERAREDLDMSFLKRALEEGNGSQKKAASLLGISYDSFRGMYRKYAERVKQVEKKE